MNIMVSTFEYERMQKVITRHNVCYSPHVLDIDKYSVAQTKKREKNIVTIAWMGAKNARRKCVPEIIKAAAILKTRGINISFIIGGKIEQDAQFLKKMVDELGVSEIVKFAGPVDETSKIELLNTCGIYLQPTLFEGFGVAIAEALLCGAPVITSNVGAVDELTNGHCTYVNGKNPDEIANKIIEVFDNYDHHVQIAAKGTDFIKENYYLDRRKNDIVKILKDLEII
jgi:glycosyltransferase involved in cell wall biosynthesis